MMNLILIITDHVSSSLIPVGHSVDEINTLIRMAESYNMVLTPKVDTINVTFDKHIYSISEVYDKKSSSKICESVSTCS